MTIGEWLKEEGIASKQVGPSSDWPRETWAIEGTALFLTRPTADLYSVIDRTDGDEWIVAAFKSLDTAIEGVAEIVALHLHP